MANKREKTFRLAILITMTMLLSGSLFAQNNAPVAWWKFNEGSGDVARDDASGVSDNILNHHQWVKGVSETGLKFDGFTTLVERDAKDAPKVGPQFSIEAWVAIQTYPWNWVAIVDQEKNFRRGYYFGIDSEGHLGFQLSVWDTWHTCVSTDRLPLKQWNHVVATYDPLAGISLYINGQLAGKLAVTGRIDPALKTPLRIGRNLKDEAPTALVRKSASFPAYYSLDGILDELKIYNRALEPAEIAAAYSQLKPAGQPELAERHWPSLPDTKHFGAVYTSLKLYPEWDALWRTGPYSDVVVNFADSPFHYVFWRGANFGEGMVTENGIWVGDQSFENGTKVGTAEHMNDKHNMHSHVSIVENTDARVVVHWRYGLVDVIGQFSNVDPLTGWGDWADEYFYIYPDGVAVRYGNIHGTAKEYSFTEPTILVEPGKKPEDYVSLQAATIANDQGETRTYSWDPVSPPFPFPNQPANANIAEVNLKSEYKPFYIYQPGTTLGPYGWPPELRPEYSHFPVWDHWPVNQAPSDGRYALFPDDFGSAAVMSPDPNKAWIEGPNDTKSSYFLFGLTRQSPADLAALDLSWLQPAVAKVNAGAYSVKFEPSQKAYILSRTGTEPTTTEKINLTLAGSAKSPVVNPAFVVQDWGDFSPTVRVNGKKFGAEDLRVGLNHRLDGTDLIIWVRTVSKRPMRLTIQH
ncbi:MAG TPA: LamG domain-containing protein [Terriglobales bacterium]|nr:LamG domain-containing protein [Terriglobales bacterium]